MPGVVTIDEGALRVAIPARVPPSERDVLRRALAAQGRLEFRAVDEAGLIALTRGRDLPRDVRMVREMGEASATLAARDRAQAEAVVRELLAAVPTDEALLVQPPRSDLEAWTVLLLERPALDDSSLDTVEVTFEHVGDRVRPVIEVVLKKAARERFAALTAKLIRRRLALVFDDHMIAATEVLSVIGDGRIRIGLGTSSEAMAQAHVLSATLGNVDPLPTALELTGERITPSAR